MWPVLLTLGGQYCKHLIHLLNNPHALNIEYKVECIHLYSSYLIKLSNRALNYLINVIFINENGG